MLTKPLDFLPVPLLLGMSFPFHLHWAQSPCRLLHGALLDFPGWQGLCPLPENDCPGNSHLAPSALLPQGMSVGLSLSPWGRPLPTSTPAQNLHEAGCAAISPTSSRLPCARLCDAGPPRGRAGALPSAGCRLSASVNQQTRPRAWSELSTFLRAWGRCGEGSQRPCSSGEPGPKLQGLHTW